MSHQRGFTLVYISVGIILITILVSGVYYLGTLKGIKPQTQNPVITSNQSSQPSSTPNSLINWKIYTNTKYKFQIQYPSAWRVKQVDEESSSMAFFPSSDNDYPGIGIEISENKGWTNSTAESRLSYQEITFAGVPARVETWDFKNTLNGGEEIEFLKDGNNYRIGLLYEQPTNSSEINQEAKKIYHQMLATFKFTN